MARVALAALCCATAAASAWLVTMYFVLQHPRYLEHAAIASLFILESALTVAALSGAVRAPWFRFVVLAGALGITWAGGAAIFSIVTGSHFEGFAVIIGVGLFVQGVLTLWQFATPPAAPRN